MTSIRRHLLILVPAFAVLLALSASLLLPRQEDGLSHEEGSTYAVAEAYLLTIMAGNKEAARHLYRADPLCSAPAPYPDQKIGEHMAMLASSQVRNVHIKVAPAQGAAYTPGSETAEITFEYGAGTTWHAGTIWLVTGPPDGGSRFICYMV
jgi:hypothetical protein